MERNLDFDVPRERRNTDSLKFDFAVRRGKPEGVLPLWVADMDFPTSSYVLDAIEERAKHGIFGYTETREDYFEALARWMKLRHNLEVRPEWVLKTPGVVFALAMAVKAYTQEGDYVLIQQPVYYPFASTIIGNHRQLVDNTLIYNEDEHRYYIDFEDFENKIVNQNVKVFLLCNPHNPVARVWNKDELLQIGDICLKHNVLVISDEIHQDFTFVGKHHVFAGLKPEFEQITVTCTSPSKSFNLAGLQLANIIIKNTQLRRKFVKEYYVSGYSDLNIMGIVSTVAAYKHGDEWFNGVFNYIKSNIEYVKNYVETNLPKVKMITHEATYLVWLDFRGLGLTADEVDDIIINKSKLWLDSGRIFGETGKGFQRINVACPRATLEEALGRLKRDFQKYNI